MSKPIRLTEAEEPYWLLEAEITADQRKEWAQKKLALPDGSWPIPDKAYLAKAISSFGRAVAAGIEAKVKAWIIKRARALGAIDMLPEDWGITEAEDESLDNAATKALGDEWLVRPMAEAGSEPDGSRWQVRIIKAGRSKNKRKYTEAVLKKSAALFEGARVLSRSDEEHVEGTQKSVKNIVGWLSEVAHRKGGLYGVLNILESAGWLKTMLLDAWNKGKKDLVGLSIVADGRGKPVVENGERFIEVEEITKVSSVDIVFDPAAGGGLVKLVAAQGKEGSVDPLNKLIEALKTAKAEAYRSLIEAFALLEGKTPEETVSAIKEANEEVASKVEDALKAAGKPEPEQKPEPVKAAEAEGDEQDDKVPASVSRLVVREHLAETELPEIVKQKISKRYAGHSFVEAELEAAVKDEIDTWAELEKAGGIVRSNGSPRAQVGLNEAQRAKAALDGFFAQEDVEIDGTKVPRYRSFREAYVELTGDKGLTGKLTYEPRGRLGISEADGGRVRLRLHEVDDGKVKLAEAIQSSTFDQILGDSITRKMVRDYEESNLRIWEPLADIVPVKDFRTNRRARFGGYGNLPAVAQNAAYLALTSPTDEEATYAATKRGGTETITIEAISNDDIGGLRRIPTRLARAAAQTLHEFVLDLLNTNPNIYDGLALFRAGNNNLGTTALSVSTLNSARQRMRKQTDMSNSKRLGLVPKWLWVPIELEQTAWELVNSDKKPYTADNEANYVNSFGLQYAVIDYWTDTNNWYVTADKGAVPLIEVGFFNSETPELFTQDLPNVGDLFTNDRIVYKIRHIYGGAVLDFRGFDGSLVA